MVGLAADLVVLAAGLVLLAAGLMLPAADLVLLAAGLVVLAAGLVVLAAGLVLLAAGLCASFMWLPCGPLGSLSTVLHFSTPATSWLKPVKASCTVVVTDSNYMHSIRFCVKEKSLIAFASLALSLHYIFRALKY